MSTNRQTGRTTDQLRFAISNRAIYIVHNEAMKTYAQRLVFQKFNRNPQSVAIEVLRPDLSRRLPPRSDLVLDHAIFDVDLEASKRDALDDLREQHHIY